MQATLDACGVDEQPILPINRHHFIDWIASGTCQIIDHGTFLVSQLIQQRRLADVRSTDQRHTAQMGRSKETGGFLSLLQRIQGSVKQFANTATVHGGNAIRLPQAHLPEFSGQIFALTIINLVHRQRDRLAGGAQHLDNALVGVGKTNLAIHHKHHSVCKLNGDLRLGCDGGLDTFDVGFPATGINQLEIGAGPFSIVAHTVSSHAGSVFHHSSATAENTVHQRGLTDIRAPNDGKHANRLRAGLAFAANERRSIDQSFIALIQLIIVKIGSVLAILLLFDGIVDNAHKHIKRFAEIQIGIINGQHAFRSRCEIRDLGISCISRCNIF